LKTVEFILRRGMGKRENNGRYETRIYGNGTRKLLYNCHILKCFFKNLKGRKTKQVLFVDGYQWDGMRKR
jgi:hypothetical protein